MSSVRFYLLFLSSISLYAQQEPEVYLMDLHTAVDSFAVSNFKNISSNKGYDSQPSFTNDTQLVYAGTKNGQTEIIRYDTNLGTKSRVNKTTLGGEYSPQKFPSLERIAAVRLDPDGLQRLYSYDLNTNTPEESKELIADYKVAYFAFHDNNNVVATIIIDDQLDLFKANLTSGEVVKITSNTGRSIHKVPGTDNVSYTSVNKDGIHEVYIINILGDNQSYYVCDLPIGIQDHCWLTGTKLLLGSGDTLYVYDLFGNGKWEEVADLSSENISEINRVTVSPDQKKLAIVASPIASQLTPGEIVDKHISPFNTMDITSFSEAFSENVLVKRFPLDTMYVGRQKIFDNYNSFFEKNKNVKVSVVNRITHNDWVIDAERVINGGTEYNQATLYKTSDGLITEMTFLENKPNNSPDLAVDAQLKGYNARDIDAFMLPYSDNVIAIRYPATILFKGKEAMRAGYAPLFENTPDLTAAINNRIISGNKVIDQELVLRNGSIINAVAIYEVENDKIVKVTFLPME